MVFEVLVFVWLVLIVGPLVGMRALDYVHAHPIKLSKPSIPVLQAKTPFAKDKRTILEIEMSQMLRWEYQFATQADRIMQNYWGLERRGDDLVEFSFKIDKGHLPSLAAGVLPATISKNKITFEEPMNFEDFESTHEEVLAISASRAEAVRTAKERAKRIDDFNAQQTVARMNRPEPRSPRSEAIQRNFDRALADLESLTKNQYAHKMKSAPEFEIIDIAPPA